MTKHPAKDLVDGYMHQLGYDLREGRADSTAELHKVSTGLASNGSPKTLKEGKTTRTPAPSDQGGDGGHKRRQRSAWMNTGNGTWRASFKNARAHRSPSSAGIPWESVLRRTTSDSNTLETLQDLYPRISEVSEWQANALFGRPRDITVEVEVLPPKEMAWGKAESARGRKLRWADLEEEEPAKAPAQRKGAPGRRLLQRLQARTEGLPLEKPLEAATPGRGHLEPWLGVKSGESPFIVRPVAIRRPTCQGMCRQCGVERHFRNGTGALFACFYCVCHCGARALATTSSSSPWRAPRLAPGPQNERDEQARRGPRIARSARALLVQTVCLAKRRTYSSYSNNMHTRIYNRRICNIERVEIPQRMLEGRRARRRSLRTCKLRVSRAGGTIATLYARVGRRCTGPLARARFRVPIG